MDKNEFRLKIEQMMQLLKEKSYKEAYEILSDDNKRARYDQFGFAGVDPQAGAGQGGFGGGFGGFGFDEGDLGDIFSSFFRCQRSDMCLRCRQDYRHRERKYRAAYRRYPSAIAVGLPV